jgi:phosphate butyryltransferase
LELLTNFDQIFEKVRGLPPATVALAAAGERNSLLALKQAMQAGMVQSALLVGDRTAIEAGAQGLDFPWAAAEIVHEPSEEGAAKQAVALVRQGRARILMKGLLHTAAFLKSILARHEGLRQPGKVMSHVYVLHVRSQDRFVLVSDSAMNISPDLEAKAAIASNAAEVARSLGIALPKVAAVAAVEVVNPKMQATVDAAALAEMSRAGKFEGFVLEGPLGMDNAVSPEAARLKGIAGQVAGRADVILVPDIEVGNILSKGFAFLAGGELAGVLCGASAPVVLTSRADSDRAKLCSIALAHLLADSRS